MKLVIHTQVRENYAAHTGFTGEYYWKCKGGDTYVVQNLTAAQVAKIEKDGIPTLSKLIEQRGDYYEEYVINYFVTDDTATSWEPWETPIEFSWGGDRWLAGRTVRNDDEYGYMRKGILAKREEWIPLEGGDRGHYKCEYQTAGGWFDSETAMEQLALEDELEAA